MKSANLLDGISASSLRKIGDSDAAASMKRVPGVSVEGGDMYMSEAWEIDTPKLFSMELMYLV
jgi:hypothetical protein